MFNNSKLAVFSQKFKKHHDCYVLIGGTACAIGMGSTNGHFRTTRDLDIVLCLEDLTNDFITDFWDFIKEGEYTIRERDNGKRCFYRFTKPANPDYPEVLELFARRPDGLIVPADCHLTPIPADDPISSLSAILLDDDYYNFVRNHRKTLDGLTVLDLEGLIVLKSLAFINLQDEKANNRQVDSRNIKKHKNDIISILPLLYEDTKIDIPETIKKDMEKFVRRLQNESIDFKDTVFNGIDDLTQRLRILFGI